MISDKIYIGPFFYLNGEFLTHKIPAAQGQKRGSKLDNPYSHEKLFDDNYKCGDYINIPRGRVVWDIEADKAIIYIDICIEKKDDAVEKIAGLFGLTNYSVEHDDHYVCPDCMGDIWKE